MVGADAGPLNAATQNAVTTIALTKRSIGTSSGKLEYIIYVLHYIIWVGRRNINLMPSF